MARRPKFLPDRLRWRNLASRPLFATGCKKMWALSRSGPLCCGPITWAGAPSTARQDPAAKSGEWWPGMSRRPLARLGAAEARLCWGLGLNIPRNFAANM